MMIRITPSTKGSQDSSLCPWLQERKNGILNSCQKLDMTKKNNVTSSSNTPYWMVTSGSQQWI